jgi:hypothetical protein
MLMLGFMCCCSQVFKATGGKVDYKVGTMIEVPRGALIAGQLAKTAEFFSFGTNDLTQMTFGISRDDAQVGLVHSKLWYIASSSSSVFGWGSWWVRRVFMVLVAAAAVTGGQELAQITRCPCTPAVGLCCGESIVAAFIWLGPITSTPLTLYLKTCADPLPACFLLS